MRARTLGCLLVVTLALGLATACGTRDSATAADHGGRTLTIALPSDLRSMWANSTTVQREINITEQINEKLIEFNQDASGFEPRLAESWSQVDPLTWRFHLRRGVRFTNGEPFDAHSAKISFDAFRTAPTYQRFTGILESAAVVDDHTLDVRSTVSSRRTLMLMAMGSFQYPAEYYQRVGKGGFATRPVGTGPFVLRDWRRGTRIELAANKDYWLGAPSLDRVVYRTIPDKSAAIAAMQAGEVDMITDVPIGSLPTIERDGGFRLVSYPSNRVYLLVLGMVTDTPLRRPEVRRALQYAIDVEALIKYNLAGQGRRLRGQLLIPAFFGFDSGVEPVRYDPAEARGQLARAGYPNGFEVTFKYTSGGLQQDRELGEAMAGMLRKVGITVHQQVMESGTFATQMDSPRLLNDMWYSGTLPPPDAHSMYEQFKSDFPYSYYSNRRFDELFAQEAAASDDTTRLAIVKKMTELLREDPPAVPLFQINDLYGLGKRIEGFTPRASQFIDVYPISTG